MSEEKKDFEVKDRRIFSEDGEVKEPTGQEAPDSSAPEDDRAAAAAGEDGKPDTAEASKADEAPPMPEINFATFVVSLNASALLHLGAIEDPNSGQTDKNLPMAKQTIDILSMLEEKTAGNLTKDEENLLKNILYDLRIIYVKEKG
jgi:hypothetical protein